MLMMPVLYSARSDPMHRKLFKSVFEDDIPEIQDNHLVESKNYFYEPMTTIRKIFPETWMFELLDNIEY